MKIFNVIRKSDNKLIYTYSAESPIEWEGMSFLDFEHVEVATVTVENEPVVQPVKITKLAFRNRFKPEEKIQLELASKDDPTSTSNKRKASAVIRVYLDDVNSASFIDLNRVDTRQGVMALEASGLIGSGRALEILNTPPTEEEIYNG